MTEWMMELVKCMKLEPKMFYQTYTAHKLPKVPVTMHSCHRPTATEWCHLLLHIICSVRCTRYNALSMGMMQQSFRLCPWWPWPLTLTFTLLWARDQTRLHCEFHANPFSGSRDIWGTNKKVTDGAKNRTLLVCGNDRSHRAGTTESGKREWHEAGFSSTNLYQIYSVLWGNYYYSMKSKKLSVEVSRNQ